MKVSSYEMYRFWCLIGSVKIPICSWKYQISITIILVKPVFIAPMLHLLCDGKLIFAHFSRIITYIWADTEKLQLDLNGPFSVSASMYVMILNGNCIWASTKNRFQTEYFTRKRERERESFIMFSFWENPMDFPFTNCGPLHWVS